MTWYQKGKGHSPLEKSSAWGINGNLGEPTKFIQCPQRESHIYNHIIYIYIYIYIYICQGHENQVKKET